MDAVTRSPEDSRRRELGAFLRSRRERLSPAAIGIATGARRRTPGLRREEVAMIAGVGTTWYTWLEQGRDVRPSVEVLTALCDALRLDTVEKRHLFILAGRQQPERRMLAPEKVDGTLLHMLQSLVLQPAYVVGRRWDVLAWNDAAVAVFGDYSLLEGDARNIVHLVFTSPHHRRLLVDWDERARVVLASFRAESAKYVGDPDFERLIALMMRSSPEFRDWWPRRDVARKLTGVKHLRHPRVGAMAFEHMSLSIDDGSDMRLIVYTPLAEQNSIAKLKKLLDAQPAERRSA
ncbi:XRE family transcriptional regulator [Mesorhizobium sp. M1C.F.Ca.ET.193.01.1.1]|uniref:helix-turn-helix transcriptional regulator n=1 Tax=unclassified Mesorhizobium TaxID=325217 RepID=UPI000FD1F56D|nr:MULTISPECIES: helix-turn-helix transcriptional regulator [unclassified Mesorhizobium]TGT02798.1 XRE family transcriptional regulator [bacterium M00.F.Ca.ET.177.01.1.1]TGQ55659.1 XRE family transcriptional regulator [Mesorhizobium sp. M1C.F.Ca.ET.210.01.1.1]TGQ74114.1 XRE family transcriptional regulator [Mesorhizobium sp. M1C.F.Ca.ET.212.01.1.1]TGR12743.1 XRE family transcriptional regulator [Mesorhizobium sp. M1C.F.Ca.ET.204.01.1.1]TGR32702.1 XRE family transcriptional regulator [Mesorhizo